MKKFKYLMEVVTVIAAVACIVAAVILFLYSTSCATLSGQDGVDNDPIIFKICLQKCTDRYINNNGTKHYARISKELIRCVCITPTGDHTIYLNVQESSVEGKTNITVE